MIIALSGKCCSGKNYISSIFNKAGFTLIDVDVLSAQVFKTITKDVINIFGDEVVSNGIINRKKVGDILFKDKSKREALEKIMHPLIYKDIDEIIENNRGVDYIINIPLLNNMEFIKKLDAVIWIRSPFLLRFYRALKRDNYRVITLFRRIMTQKKLSIKYFKSTVDTYYIDNSWFSIGLESNLNLILSKFQRG